MRCSHAGLPRAKQKHATSRNTKPGIIGMTRPIQPSARNIKPAKCQSGRVISGRRNSRGVLLHQRDHVGHTLRAVGRELIFQVERGERRILANYYGLAYELGRRNNDHNDDFDSLGPLGRPLPLDPQVRYSIIEKIDRASARVEWLDLSNGQLIDYLDQAGLRPARGPARETTQRYGTYVFCKRQNLPLRSFAEAERAVPN